MKISKLRRTLAVFLSAMLVLLCMPMTALTVSAVEVIDEVTVNVDTSYLPTSLIAGQSLTAAEANNICQSLDISGNYPHSTYYGYETICDSLGNSIYNEENGTFAPFVLGESYCFKLTLTLYYAEATFAPAETLKVKSDTGSELTYEYVDYTKIVVIYPLGTAVDGPAEYTITLDYQDGTTLNGSQITSGGKLASLPTPSRQGYTFKGWFTAATGGTQVTTSTTFSGNDTIYAQWEAVSTGGDVAAYSTAYAYDCSRNPSFPTKGSTVTLRGFSAPLIDTNRNKKGTTSGDWKLIKKGAYSDSYEEGHSSTLISLLETTASNFGTEYTNIDVYELRDGDTHICYGVLSAFLSKGYFFIGTTWSNGGAGYFLSNEVCSGPMSETVTGDPTSPPEPPHTHNFGEWVVVKAATETEEGLLERVCPCGENETKVIPKLPPHVHEFGEWTIVKEATATEEGLLERVCECGETETKVIDKLVDTDKDNDNGNVVDITSDDNAGDAVLEDIEDVAENIPLTLDEYIAMLEGENLNIYLEVVDVTDASETMPEEDKSLIENKINSINNMKHGMLIDISLFKMVGNNAETRITETKAPIKIKFKITESLINKDSNVTRVYYIIRVHNGKVDVLNGSFNSASREFTFETDKFSSYAIAYIDNAIVIPSVPSEPSTPGISLPGSTHKHSYEYNSDEANHWLECSCGAKANKKAHTFGEWMLIRPATEDEDGLEERKCTRCGYCETREIVDVSSAAGISADSESLDMTEKDFTIAITFVISAALIGTTIVKRRKVRN